MTNKTAKNKTILDGAYQVVQGTSKYSSAPTRILKMLATGTNGITISKGAKLFIVKAGKKGIPNRVFLQSSNSKEPLYGEIIDEENDMYPTHRRLVERCVVDELPQPVIAALIYNGRAVPLKNALPTVKPTSTEKAKPRLERTGLGAALLSSFFDRNIEMNKEYIERAGDWNFVMYISTLIHDNLLARVSLKDLKLLVTEVVSDLIKSGVQLQETQSIDLKLVYNSTMVVARVTPRQEEEDEQYAGYKFSTKTGFGSSSLAKVTIDTDRNDWEAAEGWNIHLGDFEKRVKEVRHADPAPEYKNQWIPHVGQYVYMKVDPKETLYIIKDFDQFEGKFILVPADSVRTERLERMTKSAAILVDPKNLRPMVLTY